MQALQALAAAGHGEGSGRRVVRPGREDPPLASAGGGQVPASRSPEALLMPLLELSLDVMRSDLEKGWSMTGSRDSMAAAMDDGGARSSLDAINLAYATAKLDIQVSANRQHSAFQCPPAQM